MRLLICGGVLLVCASLTSARQKEPVPDPHNHVVRVHVKPWETDLAPDVKLVPLEGSITDARDSVLSPDGRWLAFLFSVPEEWARVAVQDTRTGKRYQLIALPLAHRPVSAIAWLDTTLLAFDRWSQPHYGMHYVVDVRELRLRLAAPFPDEFFLRQQQDTARQQQDTTR